MKLAGKPYEVHLLTVIVLYVLGFAIYLNSFCVPFIFDDYPNIHDNPAIRMTALNVDALPAAVFESHAIRRPVANAGGLPASAHRSATGRQPAPFPRRTGEM